MKATFCTPELNVTFWPVEVIFMFLLNTSFRVFIIRLGWMLVMLENTFPCPRKLRVAKLDASSFGTRSQQKYQILKFSGALKACPVVTLFESTFCKFHNGMEAKNMHYTWLPFCRVKSFRPTHNWRPVFMLSYSNTYTVCPALSWANRSTFKISCPFVLVWAILWLDVDEGCPGFNRVRRQLPCCALRT